MVANGIEIAVENEMELHTDERNVNDVADWLESTFDDSCTVGYSVEETTTIMLFLHGDETEALFEELHVRDEDGLNLPVRFLGSDGLGQVNAAGASFGSLA